MAKYRVGMEDLVEYTTYYGGKPENAARKFGLELEGDAYYAPNKKVYNDFMGRMTPKRGKVQYEEKVSSGVPTWKKDEVTGKWLVLISGDKVASGTIIEVEKRDGSKSKVRILSAVRTNQEGTLYEVIEIAVHQKIITLKPAMEMTADVVEVLKASSYQFFVEKIGRKWLDVLVTGKNGSKYHAKLLIDDTTKDVSVGGSYVAACKFKDESDRYGQKYFLYSLTVDEITAAVAERKAEAEARNKANRTRIVSQWLGWTREKAAEGYLYNKGVDVLTEYGVWDEYKDEIEATIAKVREAKSAKQAEKVAEDAKYTWLRIAPEFASIPPRGEIMFYNGRAYEVVSSKYIPEDDGEDSGAYYAESYQVKSIDVTDTEAGQALIARVEAEKAECQRIADIKKAIQDKGAPVELVDGQSVSMPSGEVLLDTFTIYGSGERIILTETEAWYIVDNGMDGDNWGRNTILTGGAGAYGWKAPREAVTDIISGKNSATPRNNIGGGSLMSLVMTKAWEIARTACAKFGGKVKEYLSEAMKMAWAEVKGLNAATVA